MDFNRNPLGGGNEMPITACFQLLQLHYHLLFIVIHDSFIANLSFNNLISISLVLHIKLHSLLYQLKENRTETAVFTLQKHETEEFKI